MVLTLAQTGSVTLTDNNETELFNVSSIKHYATWLHVNQMVAGDKLVVRVFVFDDTGTIQRKYLDVEIVGAQTVPAIFIPFVPSGQYRVTIQQTEPFAGPFHTYNFQRYET